MEVLHTKGRSISSNMVSKEFEDHPQLLAGLSHLLVGPNSLGREISPPLPVSGHLRSHLYRGRSIQSLLVTGQSHMFNSI